MSTPGHPFTTAGPDDPYCRRCNLPEGNARHRGTFTATITIHGNVLASVREEAFGVYQFVAKRDEGNPTWSEITLPE